MAGVFLGSLFVFTVLTLIRTGVVMVLFGIVHHDAWAAVPAFGFGETFLITLLVSALVMNTSVESK